MKRQFFFHFIHIALGALFVFSAVAKFLTVDNFELYIFSQQLFGFDLSGIASRIIISVELALGLMLIFNLYFKFTYRVTLYLLLIFSLFLAYKLVVARNENCNCFGEFIVFNPAESLLKNFIFIILLFLIKNNQTIKFRFAKPIVIVLLILCFALPVIISPPDIIYRKLYPVRFNNDGQDFVSLSDTTLNVGEGKKVLAFFSMGCKYCLLAAHKISIIADKKDLHNNIYYVFFGDEKNIEGFWEKSQSQHFKHTILPFEEVFKITGGHMPSILFVDNGYVKNRTGYRDLTEKQFADFFN